MKEQWDIEYSVSLWVGLACLVITVGVKSIIDVKGNDGAVIRAEQSN